MIYQSTKAELALIADGKLNKRLSPKEENMLAVIHRLGYAPTKIIAEAVNSEHRLTFEYLDYLKRAGYIDSGSYNIKGFNFNNFYCLKKKGATYVAKELEGCDSVYYPENGVTFGMGGYWHRLLYAEFLYQFHTWADKNDGEVIPELIASYFHKEPGQKYARTRVEIQDEEGGLEPDGVIKAEIGTKKRLIVVEVDRITKTSSLLNKVRRHKQALDEGVFRKHFKHHQGNFVLMIVENETKLRNLIALIHKGKIQNYEQYMVNFHFTTYDDIEKKGIENAFYTANGEKSRLFSV